MKRSQIFRSFALLFLLLAAASSANAQTVLKASHQWNTRDVRHKMVQIIADEVKKADVGMRVDIYPKKSLYKPKAQWHPLTRGELAISAFPLAYAANVHPEFDVTLMPGLVKNHDHAKQLNNSNYMKDIKRIINRAGIVILADTWLAGGFVSKKNCILDPENIRGQTSRAAGKAFSRMLAGAGAKIVSMPSSEIHSAMGRGVLESANTSSGSLVSYKIYEHTKCLTIPGKNALWFMYEPILMSKKIFSSLTRRQQEVLLQAGQKAEKYFDTQAREMDNVLVDVFRKKGVKIVEMSEAQTAKWRRIAEKTSYAEFIRRVPRGRELINKALGEFKLWSSTERGTPYEQAKTNANKLSVSVMSAEASGTSLNFATDMASVLNSQEGKGLRLLPIVGIGGVQTIRDILFLRGIDMGITQTDHLDYLERTDPVLFNGIKNKIRYIAKLYDSEFHVIARKDVRSINDLRGKTVNFINPSSATGVGGQAIFKALGVRVNDIYIDTSLALKQVQQGKIAATVILSGAPIARYRDIPTGSELHFVPIRPTGRLLRKYLPAKLTAKDYPNLVPAGQSIPTISSSTVLAVYNWPKDSSRYKKLEVFVNKFFSHIREFRQSPRHAKWGSVNLTAKVAGWKRFQPAKEFLKNLQGIPTKAYSPNKGFQARKKEAPTLAEFKKFLGDYAKNKGRTAKQDKELYSNFLRWMKDNQ